MLEDEFKKLGKTKNKPKQMDGIIRIGYLGSCTDYYLNYR